MPEPRLLKPILPQQPKTFAHRVFTDLLGRAVGFDDRLQSRAELQELEQTDAAAIPCVSAAFAALSTDESLDLFV